MRNPNDPRAHPRTPARPNPREDDIMAGDRRISRPDSALPDWYLPDARYRPIPIAWFAAALVLQVIAQPTIFFALLEQTALATILAGFLASLAIGHLAWERGMARAGAAWKGATIAMLAVVWAVTVLGALARV
ncbi:MAG: hypothetical protein V2J51_04415 [Erythrobacter sp.]|jgi:hypothetical protein|nr:hypothetical protein [Erythrobacter sp.]